MITTVIFIQQNNKAFFIVWQHWAHRTLLSPEFHSCWAMALPVQEKTIKPIIILFNVLSEKARARQSQLKNSAKKIDSCTLPFISIQHSTNRLTTKQRQMWHFPINSQTNFSFNSRFFWFSCKVLHFSFRVQLLFAAAAAYILSWTIFNALFFSLFVFVFFCSHF